MIDMENVKKGLEHCLTLDSSCEDCPYYSHEDIQKLDCVRNLRQDALALLKEQEPVKSTYESFSGDIIARCSDGYIVRYEYCPMCGQVVKRDG